MVRVEAGPSYSRGGAVPGGDNRGWSQAWESSHLLDNVPLGTEPARDSARFDSSLQDDVSFYCCRRKGYFS